MKLSNINNWNHSPGLIARPGRAASVINRARQLGGLPHTGGELLDLPLIVLVDLGEDDQQTQPADKEQEG